MKYKKLGKTDIDVSLICLGTMTFGEQNTEAEAHQQLSYSLERGINFFDTAEMYPVPPRAETHGESERMIGSWLKGQKRDEVIIASKVTGPTEEMKYLRGDRSPRLTREDINFAVERSLKNLDVDYIDLYQLHWPDRSTNYFGKLGFEYNSDEISTPLEESLDAMNELVKAGKVRNIGLSNDTPWGVSKAFEIAKEKGYDRVVSVQNPYNLLNRSYEVGMAEISVREECGLLAYSPLAFGMLTGKYRGGAKPEGARLTLYDRFQRYTKENGIKATEEYCKLAEEFGITPTQMALAYINTRSFVTSNIITATTMEQLKEDIDSIDIALPDALLEKLEEIHNQIPNPCP